MVQRIINVDIIHLELGKSWCLYYKTAVEIEVETVILIHLFGVTGKAIYEIYTPKVSMFYCVWWY